jgi:pyridinium-3,5-bisthiocarboxylic acid mononucleotide nickel chelatase
MKVAYFDCFAGAAGDMILGALLDAGLPLERLEAALASLSLPGWELSLKRVMRCGVSATHLQVLVAGEPADRHEHQHGRHDHEHDHHYHEHRPLKAILELLERSDLAPEVADLARRIFLRLGAAESQVHGVPAEEVHFHEVGSTDAIVDIVGAAAAVHLLSIERVVVSPIHVGRGFVQTAHGLYPVPAPATAYLLEGAQVYSTHVEGELITPTGAAILTELAAEFGPLPAMRVTRTGYGAGTREREIPNVLRVLLGEVASDPATEAVTELAANIDDMNPQFYDHLMERLLSAGALDVWLAPVHMKKTRPAVVLHVLARPSETERLSGIVLAETTTLGVRSHQLQRLALPRQMMDVTTPWGTVPVKVARQGDQVLTIAPEYEDCRRLAREHQVPLKLVHETARQEAGSLLRQPTA